jgi:hypothetical protein
LMNTSAETSLARSVFSLCHSCVRRRRAEEDRSKGIGLRCLASMWSYSLRDALC